MGDSMHRLFGRALFIYLSLFCLYGNDAAAASCPDQESRAGNYTARQTLLSANGPCYIEIFPVWTMDMISRSYSYDDNGQLMIFSTYGRGDESRMTSAREFYFFPRKAAIGFRVVNNSIIRLQLQNGSTLDFDGVNEKVVAFSGGTFSFDPRIIPQVRGGLELRPSTGLILDAGYRLGGSPILVPMGVAEFRDARGTVCSVQNQDLFSYSGANQDPEFKFSTDAQLKSFLQTKCPALAPLYLEE